MKRNLRLPLKEELFFDRKSKIKNRKLFSNRQSSIVNRQSHCSGQQITEYSLMVGMVVGVVVVMQSYVEQAIHKGIDGIRREVLPNVQQEKDPLDPLFHGPFGIVNSESQYTEVFSKLSESTGNDPTLATSSEIEQAIQQVAVVPADQLDAVTSALQKVPSTDADVQKVFTDNGLALTPEQASQIANGISQAGPAFNIVKTEMASRVLGGNLSFNYYMTQPYGPYVGIAEFQNSLSLHDLAKKLSGGDDAYAQRLYQRIDKLLKEGKEQEALKMVADARKKLREALPGYLKGHAPEMVKHGRVAYEIGEIVGDVKAYDESGLVLVAELDQDKDGKTDVIVTWVVSDLVEKAQGVEDMLEALEFYGKLKEALEEEDSELAKKLKAEDKIGVRNTLLAGFKALRKALSDSGYEISEEEAKELEALLSEKEEGGGFFKKFSEGLLPFARLDQDVGPGRPPIPYKNEERVFKIRKDEERQKPRQEKTLRSLSDKEREELRQRFWQVLSSEEVENAQKSLDEVNKAIEVGRSSELPGFDWRERRLIKEEKEISVEEINEWLKLNAQSDERRQFPVDKELEPPIKPEGRLLRRIGEKFPEAYVSTDRERDVNSSELVEYKGRVRALAQAMKAQGAKYGLKDVQEAGERVLKELEDLDRTDMNEDEQVKDLKRQAESLDQAYSKMEEELLASLQEAAIDLDAVAARLEEKAAKLHKQRQLLAPSEEERQQEEARKPLEEALGLVQEAEKESDATLKQSLLKEAEDKLRPLSLDKDSYAEDIREHVEKALTLIQEAQREQESEKQQELLKEASYELRQIAPSKYEEDAKYARERAGKALEIIQEAKKRMEEAKGILEKAKEEKDPHKRQELLQTWKELLQDRQKLLLAATFELEQGSPVLINELGKRAHSESSESRSATAPKKEGFFSRLFSHLQLSPMGDPYYDPTTPSSMPESKEPKEEREKKQRALEYLRAAYLAKTPEEQLDLIKKASEELEGTSLVDDKDIKQDIALLKNILGSRQKLSQNDASEEKVRKELERLNQEHRESQETQKQVEFLQEQMSTLGANLELGMSDLQGQEQTPNTRQKQEALNRLIKQSKALDLANLDVEGLFFDFEQYVRDAAKELEKHGNPKGLPAAFKAHLDQARKWIQDSERADIDREERLERIKQAAIELDRAYAILEKRLPSESFAQILEEAAKAIGEHPNMSEDTKARAKETLTLIAKARKEKDPEKRIELLNQAMDVLEIATEPIIEKGDLKLAAPGVVEGLERGLSDAITRLKESRDLPVSKEAKAHVEKALKYVRESHAREREALHPTTDAAKNLDEQLEKLDLASKELEKAYALVLEDLQENLEKHLDTLVARKDFPDSVKTQLKAFLEKLRALKTTKGVQERVDLMAQVTSRVDRAYRSLLDKDDEEGLLASMEDVVPGERRQGLLKKDYPREEEAVALYSSLTDFKTFQKQFEEVKAGSEGLDEGRSASSIRKGLARREHAEGLKQLEWSSQTDGRLIQRVRDEVPAKVTVKHSLTPFVVQNPEVSQVEPDEGEQEKKKAALEQEKKQTLEGLPGGQFDREGDAFYKKYPALNERKSPEEEATAIQSEHRNAGAFDIKESVGKIDDKVKDLKKQGVFLANEQEITRAVDLARSKVAEARNIRDAHIRDNKGDLGEADARIQEAVQEMGKAYNLLKEDVASYYDQKIAEVTKDKQQQAKQDYVALKEGMDQRSSAKTITLEEIHGKERLGLGYFDKMAGHISDKDAMSMLSYVSLHKETSPFDKKLWSADSVAVGLMSVEVIAQWLSKVMPNSQEGAAKEKRYQLAEKILFSLPDEEKAASILEASVSDETKRKFVLGKLHELIKRSREMRARTDEKALKGVADLIKDAKPLMKPAERQKLAKLLISAVPYGIDPKHKLKSPFSQKEIQGILSEFRGHQRNVAVEKDKKGRFIQESTKRLEQWLKEKNIQPGASDEERHKFIESLFQGQDDLESVFKKYGIDNGYHKLRISEGIKESMDEALVRIEEEKDGQFTHKTAQEMVGVIQKAEEAQHAQLAERVLGEPEKADQILTDAGITDDKKAAIIAAAQSSKSKFLYYDLAANPASAFERMQRLGFSPAQAISILESVLGGMGTRTFQVPHMQPGMAPGSATMVTRVVTPNPMRRLKQSSGETQATDAPASMETLKSFDEALKDLGNPDVNVRRNAVLSLLASGDARAIEPLVQAMKDEKLAPTIENGFYLYAQSEDSAKEAVESLLKALKSEDANLRYSAARLLLQFTDAGVSYDELQPNRPLMVSLASILKEQGGIEALVEALNDPDQRVRSAAADALIGIGQDAMGSLLDAVQDSSKPKEFRERVSTLLLQMGMLDVGEPPANTPALDHLIGALGDPRPGVAYTATSGLVKMGEPAVEKLTEALRSHSNPEVRVGSAKVLGRVGHDLGLENKTVHDLLKATQDKDPRVRAAALEALGMVGGSQGLKYAEVGRLLKGLGDADETVRAEAALALERVGSQQFLSEGVAEALVQALRDPDPKVRQQADKAIVQIAKSKDEGTYRVRASELLERDGLSGNTSLEQNLARELRSRDDKLRTQIISDLVDLLQDPDTDVQEQARETLVQIGKSALEPLVDLAKSSASDEVRQQSVDLIGRISQETHTREAVPSMIELLKDPDAAVRMRAVGVLAEVGDSRAVEALGETLTTDSDVGIRTFAARALGKIGHTKGVDSLVKALDDPSPSVRRRAVQALGDIQSRKAVEPLIRVLQNRDEDPKTRLEAIQSLEKIGDTKAVQALEAIRDDASEDDVLRQAADGAKDKLKPQPQPQAPASKPSQSSQSSQSSTQPTTETQPQQTPSSLPGLPPAPVDANRPEMIPVTPRVEAPVTRETLAYALKHDPDEEVRAKAAGILGQRNDPEAIGLLIEALGDKSQLVRDEAGDALIKIGAPAISSLARTLRDADQNPRLRFGAVSILGDMGEEAVDTLIGMLGSRDPAVSAGAAWALVDIGGPAVDELVGALRGGSKEVRTGAAWALGQIGEAGANREVVYALRETMLDQDAEVVLEATRAVAAIDGIGNTLLPSLISIIATGDVGVRVDVEDKDMGRAFLRYTQRDLGPGRRPVYFNIDLSKKEKPIAAWLRSLGSYDAGARAESAESLGKSGDSRVIPALIPVLGEDKDPKVRIKTAEALGRLGTNEKGVVDALLEGMQDPDPKVREASTKALKHILDKSTVIPATPMSAAPEARSRLGNLWDDFKKTITSPTGRKVARILVEAHGIHKELDFFLHYDKPRSRTRSALSFAVDLAAGATRSVLNEDEAQRQAQASSQVEVQPEVMSPGTLPASGNDSKESPRPIRTMLDKPSGSRVGQATSTSTQHPATQRSIERMERGESVGAREDIQHVQVEGEGGVYRPEPSSKPTTSSSEDSKPSRSRLGPATSTRNFPITGTPIVTRSDGASSRSARSSHPVIQEGKVWSEDMHDSPGAYDADLHAQQMASSAGDQEVSSTSSARGKAITSTQATELLKNLRSGNPPSPQTIRDLSSAAATSPTIRKMVERALSDGNANVREVAVEVVRAIKDPEALPMLEKLAADPRNPNVQIAALYAVAEIGGKQAEWTLTNVAWNDRYDGTVRQVARKLSDELGIAYQGAPRTTGNRIVHDPDSFQSGGPQVIRRSDLDTQDTGLLHEVNRQTQHGDSRPQTANRNQHIAPSTQHTEKTQASVGGSSSHLAPLTSMGGFAEATSAVQPLELPEDMPSSSTTPAGSPEARAAVNRDIAKGDRVSVSQIPDLIEDMSDKGAKREYSIVALSKLPEASKPLQQTLLRQGGYAGKISGNDAVRAGAARALGSMQGDKESVRVLKMASRSDSSWVVRRDSLIALSAVGDDEEVVPTLQMAMGDRHPLVRETAAGLLIERGESATPLDRQGRPTFHPILESTRRLPESERLSESARAHNLLPPEGPIAIGSRKATPDEIKNHIADLDNELKRPDATVSLAEIGAPAIAPLRDVLEDRVGNQFYRAAVVTTLGTIGPLVQRDQRAVQALQKALRDGSKHVRAAAKWALDQISQPVFMEQTPQGALPQREQESSEKIRGGLLFRAREQSASDPSSSNLAPSTSHLTSQTADRRPQTASSMTHDTSNMTQASAIDDRDSRPQTAHRNQQPAISNQQTAAPSSNTSHLSPVTSHLTPERNTQQSAISRPLLITEKDKRQYILMPGERGKQGSPEKILLSEFPRSELPKLVKGEDGRTYKLELVEVPVPIRIGEAPPIRPKFEVLAIPISSQHTADTVPQAADRRPQTLAQNRSQNQGQPAIPLLVTGEDKRQYVLTPLQGGKQGPPDKTLLSEFPHSELPKIVKGQDGRTYKLELLEVPVPIRIGEAPPIRPKFEVLAIPISSQRTTDTVPQDEDRRLQTPPLNDRSFSPPPKASDQPLPSVYPEESYSPEGGGTIIDG